MDISPFVSPAISSASFTAPLTINPNSFTPPVAINPNAALIEPLTQPVVVDSSASIVDLSKLGQLLSAATFQSQQLVASATEQDARANLDNGFGRLQAAAQLFVDAFNNFQTGDVNDVNNPLFAPFAPFGNPLLLALNGLPALDNGQSLLASLARVGINFQEALPGAGNSQLTLDLTALEAAFNDSPSATSALLGQAFQTLGQIEARLVAQNVDFFAPEPNPALPASQLDLPAPFTAVANLDAALQGVPAGPVPGTALAANPVPGGPAETAATIAPNSALPASALVSAPVSQVSPLEAPLTTPAEVAAALQTAPAGQVPGTALAANPAPPPIVALPVESAAVPVIAVGAADAALQAALADQALRNALAANPAPVAATPAPTAPVAVTPVPTAPVATTPVSAVAATPAPTAPVAATPVPTVPVAVTPVPASPIASAAQVAAPLAGLAGDRAPLALDPSVAAAVAAYRLGASGLTASANSPAPRLPDPATEIVAVSRTGLVALDPHDGSSDARRNEAARNGALTLAETRALAASQFVNPKTVDVAV